MSSREDIHLDQCTPGETKRKCTCAFVCVCLSEKKREEREEHIRQEHTHTQMGKSKGETGLLVSAQQIGAYSRR